MDGKFNKKKLSNWQLVKLLDLWCHSIRKLPIMICTQNFNGIIESPHKNLKGVYLIEPKSCCWVHISTGILFALFYFFSLYCFFIHVILFSLSLSQLISLLNCLNFFNTFTFRFFFWFQLFWVLDLSSALPKNNWNFSQTMPL